MFIADFHIHSKYSRATSKECLPEILELWARRKGLGLIGTGDFTHPAWREELKEKLVPAEDGLYALKEDLRKEDNLAGIRLNPRFIVSGEISSIYKKNGKVRKIHNLILLPGLAEAEALSRRLESIGNLHSDGRPILGLDSRDLLEITLDVCPEAIFIPAHIWTPHFSLFGAYSGFDDIKECFEDLTGYIHALETGLSSDPPMNWRLSALDNFTLVSNSDAHSPANLAREANLFDTALSYPQIARALQNHAAKEFFGTIEFFPEEGKYHYDGHRNCHVCLKPGEAEAVSGICPVCGGRITVGVLHRAEALADRGEGFVPPAAKHFESLVPLPEVIAASSGLTTASLKVKEKYNDLLHNLGPELFILREASLSDIELKAGPLVGEGIRRLRAGKVEVTPGYDGEYGKIKILDKGEIGLLSGQLGFFNEKKLKTPAPKEMPGAKEPAHKLLEPPGFPDARRQEAPDKTPAVSPDAFLGLNREQWEAVSSSEPVIAVSAGPGTGKTRTLVSRIAYLVQECGIEPAQITAVTFTNRAAGEMRARLAKHFGNKRIVKAMTIGTFHSICLQILSGLNGHKNITVIDEYDALSIVEDILKALQRKDSPRDILREISLVKNGAPPSGEKADAPPGIYDLYCAQLEQYGVFDYDDILLNMLRLLEDKNTNGGEKILGDSFSYLLVDEFQDINAIQYRLIKEWSRNSAGLFVIGDPNQSIYGFRGADSRCFERLLADFPRTRQVRLSQNYRSTPEIIRCAQAVIAREAAGGQAPLLEAKRESGLKVRLLEADSEFSEALFVTKEINRLVGGIDMLDAQMSPALRGKKPASGHLRSFSDIAVLYRTNRQAEILEQCFQKEGIPYVVAGRDEFLSDREVRNTVAFFRFLLNPADLISLRLCLKGTAICSRDLRQKVLASYAGAGKNIASFLEITEKLLPASAPDGLSKFMELLRRYAPLIRKENPSKLLEAWIKDRELQNIPSLQLLLNMAVLQEGMPSFLQNLLLGRESDLIRSGGKRYFPDAVSLMTLHGAKGLEFPVVFLCGVKDGFIPLRNRADTCQLAKEKPPGSEPHGEGGDASFLMGPQMDTFRLAEERRLFYVGITRAQDELILLTSRTRSPFLADLPEDSLAAGNALERRKAPRFEQFKLFDRQ